MAGGEILNVGLSGLLSYQRALAVTAHNIANVNTAGYSRQAIELETRPPERSGEGYMGKGVTVAEVRRSYDQFITRQLQADTASAGQLRTQYELAADLDDLFGDAATGLSVPLQGFFSALETVADDPGSVEARVLLLGQANALADRFHAIDGRLAKIAADVRTRAEGAVSEINALADSIAKINEEIVTGGPSGGPPNDLLDQRDALLQRLAEQVTVTTVAQDDGALNVFIGSGQSLVLGGQARRLAAAPRPDDPARTDILLLGRGGEVAITQGISGGRLGGLLAFESGPLADARAELGTMALGLAQSVNAQHALGMDLRGDIGGLFFSDINAAELQDVRAVANASNTGDGRLAVTVDDAGALSGGDFRLFYDGAQYTLVRQADSVVVGTFASLPQSVEGFTVDLAAGTPAAGDSFLVRPTAGAARELSVVVADARSVALAAPIRTASAAGNLGEARIGAGEVAGLAGVPLAGNITLTYDAGAGLFNVSMPPGGTLAYDPVVDSGTEFTLSVAGFGDVLFTINGPPAGGDTLTISANAGGTGDNRNALQLAALQDVAVLAGGTATLGESYRRLVSEVGVQTRTLEINSAAQDQMLVRSQAARDNTAGVNLDEEAANLLRYQQAYQASAQVIAASRDMFQILLNAFT